jgi:hypothetical protein
MPAQFGCSQYLARCAYRLGLGGAVLAPLACCPAVHAQSEAPPAPTQEKPSSDEPVAAQPRKENEIVVTANQYYGQAKVESETEFGEEEIASQGADSIQGVLDRLAPFIDPSGNQPVILINGRPADGDRSILSYPAEALSRVAVLKPDAAAQYGYPPGSRVVNLALKKKFSSLNLDAGSSAATAGGQYGGELAAGRFAISGPSRWNVQARISADSALLKRARDISADPGVFDGTGYVAGLNGAPIDPALGAGLAGLPSGAGWVAPTLADFAATAGRNDPVDPNAFETLLPSRRNLTFGAGVTRPIGRFSASLSINATSTESNGLRGLPMASLVLPADNPWSPFANDVLLVRPFAGTQALRNDNRTQTLGGSLMLSGRIGSWQVTLSGNYARSWNYSRLDQGIDLRRAQALLDAGDPAFNPYGPWSRQLLLSSRNRSNGENASVRLNVIKTLVDLPAGPVTANVALNMGGNSLESRISGPAEGATTVTDRQSSRFDGQVSLNLPISRHDKGPIQPLGDLAVDLTAGVQKLSRNSLQKRIGAGFTWAPAPFVQLRGTLENVDAAPSPEQLDGPIVTTVNRIYDYAGEEAVDVIWITGGNPALRRGRRQSRGLNAMLRPLDSQALTLNFGYSEQVSRGGVSAFPELTPPIEAAFPERVVRDAAGHLVSVDARPINLASETSAEFSSGISLRLPDPGKGVSPALAAKRTQWTFTLNYRRRLKSELLTRPGLPVIDQLGRDSGQSRDFFSSQLTIGKRGIGTSLNASWTGGARLENPGAQEYRFAPLATFNFTAFLEPQYALPGAAKAPWLKNVRLSLDVRNVLGGYRRVTLADGSVPIGYRRDEIDPLGRTVKLSLRKRF